MERVRQRLQVARTALNTLQELTGEGTATPVVRDAAIQRFEYTFEAVWKSAQRVLADLEGVQTASPKQVVRESRAVGFLSTEDGREALAMVDDRNQTVHTYNEALAVQIYERLQGHADLMARWLGAMESRCAQSEAEEQRD